ncbi:11405_t:CDS:2, partial [Entrophospora sp. SA101]
MITELVQPIIKLIPHQLLLTSTISNQTNLPPIHPLTADVNYDYWNQTVVIAMIQNYTKLLNELKELKRKTHKFLKKMTISGIRKFGNLLLENGYIYPNETGFNDYFINYINSQSSIKELKEWKTFSKTEWCRKNLFKTIENNNNNTYIAEITLKIWPAGIPSQSLFYFAMIVVSLLLDPKHGTDMKDKHVVMRVQKFKGVDNSDDIIIDYDKYERLAISKSSESSDSNDASDSEKHNNQSENESTF